jgi:bifunctional DNA-binding transcriptional regulator/antitoxin component of YhaV-PrlF toxin-antitoxin module
MTTKRTAPIEPGYRIQLPAEWVESLGLKDRVVLTRTADGILIQQLPRATWDEIFATKLVIRPGEPSDSSEITEVTGVDLLF